MNNFVGSSCCFFFYNFLCCDFIRKTLDVWGEKGLIIKDVFERKNHLCKINIISKINKSLYMYMCNCFVFMGNNTTTNSKLLI